MHHAVLRSFFDRGKGKSAVYAVQGGASTGGPCRGREVWPGASGMPAKFAGYSCRGVSHTPPRHPAGMNDQAAQGRVWGQPNRSTFVAAAAE